MADNNTQKHCSHAQKENVGVGGWITIKLKWRPESRLLTLSEVEQEQLLLGSWRGARVPSGWHYLHQ